MIYIFVNVISILVSYFVGAIPTGYWFAKYIFNIDITKSGSGNIGATNIGRILGKKYFALVFLIDFSKAVLTLCLIAYYSASFVGQLAQMQLIFSAVALLIGNAYSIFLKFKGGKGVATTVGILSYLFPIKLLILFICTWILTLAVVRRPFVASLVAAYFSCIVFYIYFLQDNLYFFYFLIFICLWLTFRHATNIWNTFKKA
jgi:acyl phosphate:glycerol-3-phosphate acyltransferase